MSIAPLLCARARAALNLHDAGLIVVRIPPLAKSPRERNWGKLRPTREFLEDFYTANPDWNIGVLLGPDANLIDLEGDGEGSEEAFRELFDGEPPETLSSPTRRGVHYFFRSDPRLAALPGIVKIGPIEGRLAHTGQFQSCICGEVDYGLDKDVPRSFTLRPIATLPESVIAKLLATAPAPAGVKTAVTTDPDDWFNDVHIALHQQQVGKQLVWCSEVGLRVTSQTTKDGCTYLHLNRCPFKGDGHNDGDPCIKISAEGMASWACLHAKCQGKPIADLRAIFEKPKPAPEPKPQSRFTISNSKQLLAESDPPIMPLVDGLLARGDVMSLIGAPKTCKSWMVMQLALSIAGGKPFLGMETIPGRVIIFDLELRLDNIRRRLRQVAKTMGATPRALERVDFVSLKGKSISLKDIKTELLSHDEKYALVVLDPLYKALAGTDENSNGEMTEQFAILDAIAEELSCAVLVVHHASKGRQFGKSNTDVGSGAGAQSRSVDVHSTIIEQNLNPGIYNLCANVRNFSAFRPLAIQYNYPLWEVATDYVPEGRVPPSYTDWLDTIPTEAANRTETLESTRDKLGFTVKQNKLFFMAAVRDKQIEIIAPTAKNKPHKIRRLATNDRSANNGDTIQSS